MSGEENDVLESIDSSNIFDEFETDELNKEVQAKTEKNKKDMYDYISMAAGFMSIVFWISVFCMGTVYGYVNFQNNENKNASSLLSPVCNFIIGDIKNVNASGDCPSISYLDKLYSSELSEMKNDFFGDTMVVLEESFKEVNFLKSKEVVFLDTLTKDKLRPLSILDTFDTLLVNFDTNNTGRIICSDFSIDNEGILSTTCEAFSASYEKGIKGFTGTNNSLVSGTSISVAASFLNYIEKQSDDFILIDKQKTFSSTDIFDDFSQYSQKTSFELSLQYNSNNLINK